MKTKNEQQTLIIGGGIAGLATAVVLALLRGTGKFIKVCEASGRFGGAMYSKKGVGNFGVSSFGAPHVEAAWLFRLLAGSDERFRSFFIAKSEPAETDAAPDPNDRMRYYDGAGAPLDPDEVEAGIELITAHVGEVAAFYQFGKFNIHRLTPDQLALNDMNVQEWIDGKPLPGCGLVFPDVPQSAKTVFAATALNDNGVELLLQNLLLYFLMYYAGGRDFTQAESLKIRYGSDLVDLLVEWLREQGVELVLDTPVHLDTVGVPVARFPNGETEEFDWIVVATPPSVWDKCYRDDRFQMGRSVFAMVKIKRAFAETIPSWDSSSVNGQTWESAEEDADTMTMVFFAGGTAHDRIDDETLLDELELRGVPREHVVSHEMVKWGEVEYLDGSFSFIRPGAMQAISDRILLGEGSRVQFAHEALSVFYPGFANGSIDAAIRVAYYVKSRSVWV